VAVIAILFLVFRRQRKTYQPAAAAAASATPATQTAPAAEARPTDIVPVTEPVIDFASAKLEIADGKDILLTHNARSLGRHDFEEFMPVENVTYISRQHVNIWYEDGNYYIEDRSSTNGTRLNDVDIKGSGRHELIDGDVIELAGKLRITFKKNIEKEEQKI
jgi:pSer/pThr/pTyr-binding forkhead associated (FHA) protein